MATANKRPRRSPREVAEDQAATLRARLEVVSLKAQLAYYNAADRGRKNRNWRPSAASADLAIIPEAPTLVARSRHTIANTWIGRAASRSQKRNVIGRGIMVVPAAKDRSGKDLPNLNRRAADLWMRWASSKLACDLERRRSYWQMQRTLVAEEFASGEGFAVWSYLRNPRNVGLKLQLVETEQLDLTINRYNDNEVRGGIEVDEYGAAVAYHFYRRNPNDYLGGTLSTKSIRIPAERVRHYFDPDRVMQARGEPRMAPVLQDTRDYSDLKDSTLWRSRMEASIGFIIRKTSPTPAGGIPGIGPRVSGDSGTTASGMRTLDIVPGMVPELLPGEDVTPFIPQSPGNQYEPFTTVTLRGIGAGLGMSLGSLTRHNDANYSAARQDMLEDEREIGPQQDAMIDTVIMPDYELFFRFAALEGKFDDINGFDQAEYLAEPERYHDAEYIIPERPWIDPEKEINAYEKGLKLRIITRGEIVASRGGRLKNLFETLKAEREDAAAQGITLPEDVETETSLAAAEADKGAATADKAAAAVDVVTADVTKKTADAQQAAPPATDAPEGQSAGDKATGQPVPAEGPTDAGVAAETTLNGAQITAAIDVMSRIRAGELDTFSATELLVAVGIEREKAGKMIVEAKKLPPPETPPANPVEQAAMRRYSLGIVETPPKYRAADAPETSCVACRFFVPAPDRGVNLCAAYEMKVASDWTCDAFEAPPPMTPSAGANRQAPDPQPGNPPLDSPGGFDAPRN